MIFTGKIQSESCLYLTPYHMPPTTILSFAFISERIQNKILDAIKDFEKAMCVRFVEATNEDEFLLFTNEGSCSAGVGRRSSRQVRDRMLETDSVSGSRNRAGVLSGEEVPVTQPNGYYIYIWVVQDI